MAESGSIALKNVKKESGMARFLGLLRAADIQFAVGLVGIIFVMVVPMPPLLLDILLSISITFAVLEFRPARWGDSERTARISCRRLGNAGAAIDVAQDANRGLVVEQVADPCGDLQSVVILDTGLQVHAGGVTAARKVKNVVEAAAVDYIHAREADEARRHVDLGTQPDGAGMLRD